MTAPGQTPKGRAVVSRILAAAIETLSAEGLPDTTLAKIAHRAGVDKRMVLYYFGSRDQLLACIVDAVGERLVVSLDDAIRSVTDPDTMADLTVDVLWAAVVSEPEVPRAYFALLHGSGEEELHTPLRHVIERLHRLAHERIDALEHNGYRLTGDRDGFITLMLSALRGLVAEWLDVGDTPALASARHRLKAFIAGAFARS